MVENSIENAMASSWANWFSSNQPQKIVAGLKWNAARQSLVDQLVGYLATDEDVDKASRNRKIKDINGLAHIYVNRNMRAIEQYLREIGFEDPGDKGEVNMLSCRLL